MAEDLFKSFNLLKGPFLGLTRRGFGVALYVQFKRSAKYVFMMKGKIIGTARSSQHTE